MLKVIKKGMFSSIQDSGRYQFRSYGVPVSGAMDQYAANMANLLLTNELDCAVLEVTYNGSFAFLNETQLCISGAHLKASINGRPVPLNTPLQVEKNSLLEFIKPEYGLRSYLAVKGGFLNKPVLGSRSLFTSITKKPMLVNGDEIFYEPYSVAAVATHAHPKIPLAHFDSSIIEVYKGPEFEMLESSDQQYFESKSFTISTDHNRMGYRLQETKKMELPSLLTVAVMPGTVQLTPSGGLIILMRDCGVTGGYPRILQLTDMAINRLAQKSTGDLVQFKIVDLPQ